MSEPMEMFGKVLECRKCGHDTREAAMVYRQEPNFHPGDYIERTCRRCGYHWKELPRDAPPPATPNLAAAMMRGKRP
jgi:Zn ribbon nucleic-acid-binding protein